MRRTIEASDIYTPHYEKGNYAITIHGQLLYAF